MTGPEEGGAAARSVHERGAGRAREDRKSYRIGRREAQLEALARAVLDMAGERHVRPARQRALDLAREALAELEAGVLPIEHWRERHRRESGEGRHGPDDAD